MISLCNEAKRRGMVPGGGRCSVPGLSRKNGSGHRFIHSPGAGDQEEHPFRRPAQGRAETGGYRLGKPLSNSLDSLKRKMRLFPVSATYNT